MDIEALDRRETRKRQWLVGMLFAAALMLALLFSYWMGAFGFGASSSFYVSYDFAGGIDRGSPVRLAGIKVGRVSDFALGGAEHGQLRLKLTVSQGAMRSITEDSKFYVNLAGLIGERYIEVVPGTAPPVKAGAEYRGIDPPRVDQLISQGYGIFGDLRAIISENKGEAKEFLTILNELAKNLNHVFSGTSPQQRKQLSTILSNFASMSGDLKESVAKVNAIQLNDIRRLMLEDGVTVNFSRTKVPKSKERDED